MYSQQQHYPVDNTLYLQQQQQQQQYQHLQQQQQRLQPPLHPTVLQQRIEPLPSATNDKPNISLSIAEIADFSSNMVYLMWHARRQSVMDLHSGSKIDNTIQHGTNSLEQTRVTADMASMTSAAFKKFCKQILTATQLSESVVLLSLKYIAMLLSNNPNIQGADGSEYRLFTVALMLANKFLDDNTFTNKTWSEVSGMKVIDLNIMELEFLDVLRFRLSICKEEYERWRTALFNFRSQLLNVPNEIQRQKLMETMALSVGNQQQQSKPWQPQQQVSNMQQQQQQHAAAVAAATHNFYLFSKAQHQFSVPQSTFSGPLTRVPLRIPAHPVYHNIQTTPSAPPNVMYENRPTTATIPIVTNTSPSNPIQHNRYSTGSRRPTETGGYAPYQKQPTQQPQQQQPQQRIPSSTSSSSNNTIVASRPTTPSSVYPLATNGTSPYSQNGQQPYGRSYAQNNNTAAISTSTNASSRVSHRTSSLPQQGGLEMNIKATSGSAYYATPPPSSNLAYQPQQPQYPTTTSYYVDPSLQSNAMSATTTSAATTTVPSDYNPYVTAASNNSSNINDVYNRPMAPRSTSYKNVQPQQPQQQRLPITPNHHHYNIALQQQQQHQQQQEMYSQPIKRTYNGPTMEDPLTAIDSYRTNR